MLVFNALPGFARRGCLATAMSLAVGSLLGLARGQWPLAMLDASCVGIGCWLGVDLGRMWVARWRWRWLGRELDDPNPAPDGTLVYWPGWGWMSACLAGGTVLGVLGGASLARWLAWQWGWIATWATPSPGGDLSLGVLLMGSLGVALALSYVFYARERVAVSLKEVEAARRVAAESQLRLLQAQLEPHMLFNTLANLRVLIQLDAPRAQAMLDHLIGFLRATLHASRQAAHPLSAEFDRVADYLALMQVRMGARLQTQLDLPEALATCMVPPLLLQPLVENAIQHGLEPKLAGGRLTVQAERVDGMLTIRVGDTGLGLRAGSASRRSGGGFGLQQVRERLSVTWGEAAALTLQDQPGGGTLVTLTLPCTSAASPATGEQHP